MRDYIKILAEAERYIADLGWVLTFVRGGGENPKKPLFQGWPDLRPTVELAKATLEFHGDAGIGINLGASKLVDVEADSFQGERILDDLCAGESFPCWRSKRGKHRLFLAEDLTFLKNDELGIEFRTGRHQSILPPSVIGDVTYEWIVSPFDVAVSPMPARLREYYQELRNKPGSKRESTSTRSTKQRWAYRDNLDYVLRQFELKAEVEKVGLRFAVQHTDRNGNIPCFVPSQLRDGNEDESPSGIFNVFNGTLKDFATGKNHKFFHLMESLIGRPWQHIFAEYEAEAGSVSGRPHSRRISLPDDSLTNDERKPLEDVRAQLGAYYDAQLSREPIPKVLHIIKGPPGVGKTYGLCKKLAECGRKAIILTLENELASTHKNLIHDAGGNARRMPILRETPCPRPDDYEKMARRKFKPSQSFPCRTCSIGPSHCSYLLGFRDLADADQLCAAAIYHTHRDFYKSHGNEKRSIVVFDENCIDLLLEPVSHSLAEWRSWLEMVRRWDPNHELTNTFQRLVEWIEKSEQSFLGALDSDGEKLKFSPVKVPQELKRAIPSTASLREWLDKNAFKDANRGTQNLIDTAVYLLSEPDSYVLLERICLQDHDLAIIRFRKRNPLPEDKEVFILDATANEDMLRAIAPDWDIRVWDCPLIEQTGDIIQIMDYDLSRNKIKKELGKHEVHNPAWLIQVIDSILAEHGPAALITFKGAIDGTDPSLDFISRLEHRDLITRTDNFPCRGHSFEEETLIVVGTPYKDQASIWELALALWGEKGLPTSEYTRREFSNGSFVSNLMSYDENRLKPIHDFMVSADLIQAIGRVRPLQRPIKVFVLSPAVITDWDVQQFMASELFDLRKPLRKDKAEHYATYLTKAKELLGTDGSITNREICEAIKMAPRTGQNHWSQLQKDLINQIEVQNGRIRKPSNVILL